MFQVIQFNNEPYRILEIFTNEIAWIPIYCTKAFPLLVKKDELAAEIDNENLACIDDPVLVNSYRTLFLRNFRTQLVFDHH